jgi:GAF domain-containing protein
LRKQTSSDAVFLTLTACTDQIEAWLTHSTSPSQEAAARPDDEKARADALTELGIVPKDTSAFDRLTQRLAQEFGTPIALVSLLGSAAGSHDKSHAAQAHGAEEHHGDESLEAHVAAANELLVVEDVEKDPRFATNPMVLEKGIRFYAGAPLRTTAGTVIGALSLIDTKARSFTLQEEQRLQSEADILMAQLASGHPEPPDRVTATPPGVSDVSSRD